MYLKESVRLPGHRGRKNCAFTFILFLSLLLFSAAANGQSPVPSQNLQAWWKAESGVVLNGSRVSQWKDSSGMGVAATQSLATAQPVWVANAINGKPALKFDGSQSVLNFPLTVSGSTGLTMIIVASNSPIQNGGSVGSYNAAMCWDETGYWGSVYVTPFQSTVSYRFGTGQTGNVPTYTRPASIGSSFSITAAVKNGTNESLFVNGALALQQGGKLAAIANVSSNAHFGKGYQGNFAGQIAEVLIYNRALTTVERKQVESYLMNKYLPSLVPVNKAPQVSAGAAQSIVLPATAKLQGSATDDGLPSNQLAIKWSVGSGPGSVTFSNPNATSTSASFSSAGAYSLALFASDGVLSSTSYVSVTVLPQPAPVPPPGPGDALQRTYPTADYLYPSDSGYFNVRNAPYNCFGDGIHDDTACIKAAMKDAMLVPATGGRHATVYFPQGTYLISDSLLWATYGNQQAQLTAQIDPSRGCITGFTIVNGGSGYGPAQRAIHGESNPGPGLYIMGGGGSRQELYVDRNTSTGAITGFVQTGIDNEGTAGCYGHGYTSAPTVTVVNWKAYLRFEGQNKANTILKLTDHNPKFQNANCNISTHGDNGNRESCRAMIFTAGEGEPSSTSITERAYEDDIWNMTINTGAGNPGAIAIDWIGSNRASVKNVNILSEDGQGRCGLNVSRGSGSGSGPALVKNVSVKGFDYGVYALTKQERLGNTFEYMDFSNIHKAGVLNGNMPNWFRQIYADISVPVFVDQARGSLLVTDGWFEGGSSNVAAIQLPATSMGGVAFLRNIQTVGYQAALSTGSGNTIVPGSEVVEYAYPEPAAQFQTTLASLNLRDIPNTPEYVDNNLSDWTSVSAYGSNCMPNTNRDATVCIQAAINSGKPVIYFPFGNYWTSSTIHVPSTVRAILGMNSFLTTATASGRWPNGDGNHRAQFCVFQFEGRGSNPVEFRNIGFDIMTQPAGNGAGTVCYAGSAPLVVADSMDGVNLTTTANSSGDVYLENVAYPNGTFALKPTQHVYARQYDVESGSGTHVTVNGGIWWMFGFKSEGSGLLWNVNNSTLELLGTFALAQGPMTSNPAFRMTNSKFTLAGVTATPGGWSVAVSEQQGGTVKNQSVNGSWFGGIGYGLYAGQR